MSWGEGWKPWFAWRPVVLLTGEIAWLRRVERKRMKGYNSFWKPERDWGYANLNPT